jgi:uncharacterized protein (DUF58 family)
VTGAGTGRTSDRRIDWEPASWLFGVVALVAVLLLAVVAVGRADILVFLAPLVGALAGAWWSVRPERTVRLSPALSQSRVFEGDLVRLDVEMAAPDGVDLSDLELDPGDELVVEGERIRRAADGTIHASWELRARRWGRVAPRVRLATSGAAGLLVGQVTGELGEVSVFPHADRVSSVPRPLDLPDLLGVHLGRRKGEGLEFAGIREYLPGDPLRSVNWPVSARRGSLHVTERLTEQSAKVVCLIDAAGDVLQEGPSTLELSVHGSLAVCQAALRRGDRAGVIAVGGMLRWLSPDLGERHFYQIVEALLDVRPGGGSTPDSADSFPRTMLPRGAVLVVFSPLLDERMVHALIDLRRRGYPLAVVDVLRSEPRPRPKADYDPLAVQMWRIGRRAVRHRLGDVGIPVGRWGPDVELDEVLRPMSLRPLAGSRR